METQNTIEIEIKKAIVYQYYGHEYIYKNSFGTFKGVVGDYHFNSHTENPTFKLMLKSISRITVEDSKSVAEILEVRGDGLEDNNVQETIIGIIADKNYIFENVRRLLRAMQFLQSEGYAMPYINYSVEDLINLGVYYIKK